MNKACACKAHETLAKIAVQSDEVSSLSTIQIYSTNLQELVIMEK